MPTTKTDRRDWLGRTYEVRLKGLPDSPFTACLVSDSGDRGEWVLPDSGATVTLIWNNLLPLTELPKS